MENQISWGLSGRLGSAEESKMAASRRIRSHRWSAAAEVRHGNAAVRKHVQTSRFDIGLVSRQCDSSADGILRKGVMEIFREEIFRDS